MGIMIGKEIVKASDNGNYGTCSTVTLSKQDIIIMLQQLDGMRRKLKAKLQTV
jgi:hypothetical protein